MTCQEHQSEPSDMFDSGTVHKTFSNDETTAGMWLFVVVEGGLQVFAHFFPVDDPPLNPIPDAPCVEYLPTFGSFLDTFRVNVGKYSIHGASGYWYLSMAGNSDISCFFFS